MPPKQPSRSATSGPTAEAILDVAMHLAQTRGFNGFSYSHIAAEVGLTTASLHYHFPTKAHLGEALVVTYRERFKRELEAIALSPKSSHEKLSLYTKLYQDVLAQDRMCLCGMLAAEYATLPAGVQREVKRFFDENEEWLVKLLEEGRADSSIRVDGETRHLATLLTSLLEGAMLVARSSGDQRRFDESVDAWLTSIRGEASVG